MQPVRRTKSIVFREGHPVLGQGACFIRTDNRCASECFNRRKMADHRFLFCHTFYAKRQHDRHQGGKTFRNGGNPQTDGCHKHGKDWFILVDAEQKNDPADQQCQNTQ